ncbi:MAG: hypothetical protein E6Q97_09495 [Desulfurellales bacterium]|nr:MAG: hypothetical protein E6Q97_09495 [Desulfurellales bacterium]
MATASHSLDRIDPAPYLAGAGLYSRLFVALLVPSEVRETLNTLRDEAGWVLIRLTTEPVRFVLFSSECPDRRPGEWLQREQAVERLATWLHLRHPSEVRCTLGWLLEDAPC